MARKNIASANNYTKSCEEMKEVGDDVNRHAASLWQWPPNVEPILVVPDGVDHRL